MRKGLILSALAFILATSCNKDYVKPSGNITTEIREAANYDRIVVSDAISANLTFTSGPETVEVSTHSNLQQHLETEVSGNTLYIRWKDGIHIKGNYSVQVVIHAQNVKGIDLSGASNMWVSGQWNDTDQALNLSGASHFEGQLSGTSLDLDLSGASSAELNGNTGHIQMDLSGASNMKDAALSCYTVNADLSGASSAELRVEQSLNLQLSGGSSFRYTGNGAITQLNTSGGSSVIHF